MDQKCRVSMFSTKILQSSWRSCKILNPLKHWGRDKMAFYCRRPFLCVKMYFILIKISLKFDHNCQIHNKSIMVRVKDWCWTCSFGDHRQLNLLTLTFVTPEIWQVHLWYIDCKLQIETFHTFGDFWRGYWRKREMLITKLLLKCDAKFKPKISKSQFVYFLEYTVTKTLKEDGLYFYCAVLWDSAAHL